jgi:hypothetical protein
MQKHEDNLTALIHGNGLQPLAGASVTVTNDATGLSAALYRDNGITPLLQPLTTDALGYFAFYAANGEYTVTFSDSRITELVRKVILNDPDDDPAATLSELAAPTGAWLVGFGARTVNDKLGEAITLADYPTTAEAVSAASGKRLYVGPGESVTISVPAQFATIQAAFTAISGWIIANTGAVTIQVADGTYVLASSISLNHPYGDRIRLVGNTSNPSACVLMGPNPPTFDAIACTNGSTFGQLDGFKLDLPSKAAAANNYTAVLALNGASVICGTHMVVNNWYYGIAARTGAMVSCASAVVSNAGDVGIWSFVGSTVYAPNAVVTGVADAPNGLGFGLQAEYGSVLECGGASASSCLVGGIASLSNSNVRALNAAASNNTGSGFFARDGGTIEAHGATTSTNTRYGVEVLADGHVYYSSITATGNTLGNFAPRAYFDNGALGARIVADDGDVRFDLSSAGSWFFNSPGGLQLRINHTASAVNQYAVTGSAAGAPVVLQAAGTDTNIEAYFAGKGTGSAWLRSNGVAVVRGFSGSASNTDYAQVDAGTGLVVVAAQGGSSDITMRVNGKGAKGTMIESSTSKPVGFFGSTGATKATVAGSRGGNAALASLLTQLASYGLITDSTTA